MAFISQVVCMVFIGSQHLSEVVIYLSQYERIFWRSIGVVLIQVVTSGSGFISERIIIVSIFCGGTRSCTGVASCGSLAQPSP